MELDIANRKELVMIIDDTLIDQFVAERMIVLYGFSKRVIVFESGISALEYLSRPDLLDDEIPQVIFLDIRMPEMDGFEYLDAYAILDEKVKSKIKIVMLTSSFSESDRERANSSKYVNYFLTKPLDEDKLGQLNNI